MYAPTPFPQSEACSLDCGSNSAHATCAAYLEPNKSEFEPAPERGWGGLGARNFAADYEREK